MNIDHWHSKMCNQLNHKSELSHFWKKTFHRLLSTRTEKSLAWAKERSSIPRYLFMTIRILFISVTLHSFQNFLLYLVENFYGIVKPRYHTLQISLYPPKVCHIALDCRLIGPTVPLKPLKKDVRDLRFKGLSPYCNDCSRADSKDISINLWQVLACA